MKEKYINAYMDMAARFADTSEATRLKVAALLVKNDAVISLGINGTPPRWVTNQCETPQGSTEWFVTHAEDRALSKLINSTETANGAAMFITHSPCHMCSIRIVDAGIKQVYYREHYRDTAGLDYLVNNGVEVYKL